MAQHIHCLSLDSACSRAILMLQYECEEEITSGPLATFQCQRFLLMRNHRAKSRIMALQMCVADQSAHAGYT
jgi:hypothetical protein